MRKSAGRVAIVIVAFSVMGAAHTSVSGAETDGTSAEISKAKKKKPRKKPVRPRVKIQKADQTALTGKGVRLRVSANRRARVRVMVMTSSFDEGNRVAAKPRVIRFKKRGKKIVNIRLLPESRQAAALCAERTVLVKIKSGKRSRQARASMTRRSADCVLQPVDLGRADSCDFIAQPKEGLCLMPFPNDYYTRADSSSPTGKRIDLSVDAMPKNQSGVPIDPTPYLQSDGFSQGQGIVMKVPGLDTAEAVAQNDFVSIDRLSRYAEPDQKAVVIDTKTGERWPIWVEIDANASGPAAAALLISPARNFDEKGRYIVALRNLTDRNGNPLAAPNAFRYYRDGLPSDQAEVNERRPHFEGIFEQLRDAGIKRSELYLAWDFTVASDENNYRRSLHMRDEAFKTLGDTTMGDRQVQGVAPQFEVTSVPPEGLSPNIGRRVVGTFTVPCFLTNGCQPGGVMNLDQNGLPQRNGNYVANFQCIIPPVGLSGGDPPKLRPFVYGHGLLSGAEEIRFEGAAPPLSQGHEMIGCATDEIGMAGVDIGTVIGVLNELSNFPAIPDRLQQGLINELFLARLMYHPAGLGSHPAFQDANGIDPGDSVIDTDDVHYMGASQGGIMGGALTAISPDFVQSAMVVGGMNYSTLLTRSSNWRVYGVPFNSAYRAELSRPLILNLIQLLWDRGEANGYAHRMTDNPPPNTPEHNLTLIVAVGDHQVANFTADVWARTSGLATNRGAIDPLRWPDYEDLWDVRRIGANEYPYRGSNIVYWDAGPFRRNPENLSQLIGTGTPPLANVAPNPDWEDPHSGPRGVSGPISMMGSFLQPNGYIEDTCGDKACVGAGWDGDFSSVIPP